MSRPAATLPVLGCLAVLALASLGSVLWAADTSTVTITNKSSWQLDRLYMSPADSDDWGPDQLGDKVIKPGESFALTDVPCNKWDLKLVDEDGDGLTVDDHLQARRHLEERVDPLPGPGDLDRPVRARRGGRGRGGLGGGRSRRRHP